MNTKEMTEAQRIALSVRAMDRQLKRVPELVASGALQRTTGGWYLLRDIDVMNEICHVAYALRWRDFGEPPMVKLRSRDGQFESLLRQVSRTT